MAELQCPICGKDMKIVPAGISKKSGKPYDSFAACTDYGCRGTLKLDPQGTPKPNAWSNAQKSVTNTTSQNIAKFEAGKEANMKRMASGRDATLIVVAEMTQGSAWSEEDIKKRIQMYAKWFEETIYNPPFVG